MYKILSGTIVALGLAGTTLALSVPANAEGIGISFDVGNVAFGYRDGYWDQGHHWHKWRNQREASAYRHAHGDQYKDYRHDRDQDQGWHR